MRYSAASLACAMAWLLCSHVVWAEEEGFSRQGADSCLKCHDESSEFPVLEIFRTPHGQQQLKQAPMAGLQCEACHGPAGQHAGRIRPGKERPPVPNFASQASASRAEQNQACLGCHQGETAQHWPGGAHEQAELLCSDCHQIHAPADRVLSKSSQTPICTSCHLQQSHEILRPSSHPLNSGEMSCSDCHAAHGSAQDAELKGEFGNPVCMDCHAEKRGPFLWEHAPVTEDCALCHQPHGSNHPALLTQRKPLLCQQCHSQVEHASLPHTAQNLPGSMLSLQSCNNCHTQVHGSNHPSGSALMR